MAIIGAGAGAMSNPDDPLKGAVMGGVTGGIGSAAAPVLGLGGGAGGATVSGTSGMAMNAGSQVASNAATGLSNSMAFTPGQFASSLHANPATMQAAASPTIPMASGSSPSLLPSVGKNMLPATTANQAATGMSNAMNPSLMDKMGNGLLNVKNKMGDKDFLGKMGLMQKMMPQQPQNKTISRPNPPKGGKMQSFAKMSPFNRGPFSSRFGR